MTKQITVNLDESQIKFLERHKFYGFADRNELLTMALNLLKSELEAKDLKTSADLYVELYLEDRELQEITESAIEEWPKD
jgi:hypothetical protein